MVRLGFSFSLFWKILVCTCGIVGVAKQRHRALQTSSKLNQNLPLEQGQCCVRDVLGCGLASALGAGWKAEKQAMCNRLAVPPPPQVVAISDHRPQRAEQLQPQGELLQALYSDDEVRGLGHLQSGQRGPCPTKGKSSAGLLLLCGFRTFIDHTTLLVGRDL